MSTVAPDAGGSPSPDPRLGFLLNEMVERGASDLHLAAGSKPRLRIDGRLLELPGETVLRPEDTALLGCSILAPPQRERLAREQCVELSFSTTDRSRFRASLFRQRGSVACAIRRVPSEIKTLRELGIPSAVGKFGDKTRGLALVTGAAGSGKSTTLAAIIDKINTERPTHIITIEDPIEFVHSHKRSLISQREVGSDAASFRTAIASALRQDPDIILIGEMRSTETIQAALTVAETGHLAFATLHTNSAAETINRVIDAFPGPQQPQVRAQLALVLLGVVTQTLLPKAGGSGRVAACELLVSTPAIRALIREEKVHQIYSAMQAAKGVGMQTLNDSLYRLYARRQVVAEECIRVSPDPAGFERMARAGHSTSARGASSSRRAQPAKRGRRMSRVS